MRSFVSAACCLIVGLEVLIGVPVAVCLGFFCLGSQAVSGVYVSEAQFSPPTCPPPIYSAPVFASTPVPCGPYDATFSPTPLPPATSPASITPAAVASLPASDPAADGLPALPNTAIAVDGPQFLARVCAEVNSPADRTDCTDATKSAPAELGLLASLLASANLLYQQADRHEADQEYSLADRLRTLARDLRDEASSISRRTPVNNPAPVADPMPTAEPAPAESRTVTVGPPPRG